jgi:hypothetical protein
MRLSHFIVLSVLVVFVLPNLFFALYVGREIGRLDASLASMTSSLDRTEASLRETNYLLDDLHGDLLVLEDRLRLVSTHATNLDLRLQNFSAQLDTRAEEIHDYTLLCAPAGR